MPESVIVEALDRAGVLCEEVCEPERPITKQDLYALGLSGRADSAAGRQALLKYYNLPTRLSTNSLVQVLNMITTYNDFIQDVKKTEAVKKCSE